MKEIETDNNVLSKTSEDVKKGLECCYKGNACRGHCPYDGPENGIKGCTVKLSRDALALINRLEADNIAKAIVIEQLERERDAAVEQLKEFDCATCKHCNMEHIASICCKCKDASNWEWCRVKEEKDGTQI